MKNLLKITAGITFLVTGTVSAGEGASGHHHDEQNMPQTMQKDMNDGSHHGQMMMEGHAHSMGSLAGEPGKEENVSRVIQVRADDSMRFTHEPFNIKDGETIKFVVINKGAVPHEFAIGTKDENMEHGKMMMNNPNMHHGPGGNAITIKPGETQELIWTFENAWQIEAACNIPGHYQAGMHSPIKIEE